MNKLCQYKNIFGEPKKGIHAYRIFNIAIVDLLLTIFIAYLFSIHKEISFQEILEFLLDNFELKMIEFFNCILLNKKGM